MRIPSTSKFKTISIGIFLLQLTWFTTMSQQTVGLLSYNPSKSFDGYNLIYPHNQPHVYLLDNCGEVVHMWEGEPDTRPGNMAYLLEDGRLVKASRPASVAGDVIWAGGGGGTIEIRDWDNNLLWEYTVNDSLKRFHHDHAVKYVNGELSIYAIAWELKTLDEVIEAGRDTSVLQTGVMWPDYIIEIDPETDEIIWEWHVWDHLVQDFDSTKANYGVIADHPELVDVNYDFDGAGHPDWMHANSLDYDPFNDLLLMSVPRFHEIWVIDASTSKSDAAGHTGGFSGRGGDLMYRWGNPAAYHNGTEDNQQLFYQHDASFIDNYIDPFDPLYGKISLFNNRVGSNYSTVNILDHGFDMYKFEFPFNGSTFGPANFDQTIVHPVDSSLMYSTGLSSAQYLPNSNFLICVGRFGYAFEITPDNEIVWEYKTPLKGGIPVAQGDTLAINNNLTFRMQRIPTDFEAFVGKDLTPQGYIELDPDVDFCENILATEKFVDDIKLELFPNPAQDMITIKWDAGKYIDIDIADMQGRNVLSSMKATGGKKYISTQTWPNGMYILMVNQQTAGKFLIIN